MGFGHLVFAMLHNSCATRSKSFERLSLFCTFSKVSTGAQACQQELGPWITLCICPLNFFAPQSLVFMVGTPTLPVSPVCSEEHTIKGNRIL